jgi:hypothetical protein
MRRTALLVFSLLVSTAAVACGGDDGGDDEGAVATSTSVDESPQPSDVASSYGDSSSGDTDDGDDTDRDVSDGPAVSDDGPSVRPGRGVVVTDAGDYVFEPQTCVITSLEIEINGPGVAPDGTPVYIDMGVGDGYATFSIDIGTDSQFVSGESLLTTVALDSDLEVTVAGSAVRGAALLTEVRTGDNSEVEADIDVDCS